MSDEDDDLMDQFREAMEHLRKRHEDDVLTAAEQSLAQVVTNDCPPPLSWHPFYRGKPWLIGWLNDADPHLPTDHLRLPVPRRITAMMAADSEPFAMASLDTIILTKQRAWGPAPWVGRPFHYEWNVAKDGLGRMIAGESHIVYEPSPRLSSTS